MLCPIPHTRREKNKSIKTRSSDTEQRSNERSAHRGQGIKAVSDGVQARDKVHAAVATAARVRHCVRPKALAERVFILRHCGKRDMAYKHTLTEHTATQSCGAEGPANTHSRARTHRHTYTHVRMNKSRVARNMRSTSSNTPSQRAMAEAVRTATVTSSTMAHLQGKRGGKGGMRTHRKRRIQQTKVVTRKPHSTHVLS